MAKIPKKGAAADACLPEADDDRPDQPDPTAGGAENGDGPRPQVQSAFRPQQPLF